ncbi:hypothetical protein RJ639_043917 [Escallonia herrerae]|uniref:CCHC-type domain-containing protein n=1 Tax=Escallonia herrerae TaxID=1293975 RepID=A0AA88WGI6_9ASTE|nr:hypothetical protein RJ639_043917 [Escallonia herrerae]
MDSISGGSGSTQYGVEKLVGTNYKYWRMCMEAYLQGQDLWDLVSGADSVVPDDIPENVEAQRKWKIKCGKALFALRTSISREYIDHVRDVDSPREVWGTLERLFTKKNTARLQLLENDLATLTQGGMSISEYFLKVKNICSVISQLDMDEPISEARLRRYLIRGLRKEYMPFVTSVQGWAVQPSVEELENLLSNQEALAKQISRKSISEADDVLFSKWKLKEKENSKAAVGGDKYSAKSSTSNADSSTTPQQKYSSKKCYRCGKTGHIKKYCRVKLVKANTACENDDSDKLKWEQCFSIETAQKQGTANINAHGSMNSGVVLKDVYHVPGLKKNLVSVSQITDSGKYVLFGPKDVMVLDKLKNVEADILLVGEKKESLFVMSAGEAYVKQTSKNDRAAIWHARLGHIEDTPDNVSVSSNFDNDGHTMSTLRRSTRERRQPDYFKDYEVGLNQCSVTSCFLVGAINGSEPCCYDEARGNNEDEISRLKNDLSIRFEMKNLGEAIVANPVEVMHNCHGSHVLRSLLCLCKGVPLDSSEFHATKSSTVLAARLNIKPPRHDRNDSQHCQQGFEDLLKFLVTEMLKAAKQDIASLQVDQYSSLVLQACFQQFL